MKSSGRNLKNIPQDNDIRSGEIDYEAKTKKSIQGSITNTNLI